jgi:hypothetical protein
MRENAHTLSDFRAPTLSIECAPCGRFGRYNIARLMEKYGDAKLPEPRHPARQLPQGRSHSVYDRCKVVYGRDSQLSRIASALVGFGGRRGLRERAWLGGTTSSW